MTDKHKKIITTNLVQLSRDLTPDSILSKMRSENIICEEDQQEIEVENVPYKRSEKFLRLLMKKEDRAFRVLIEACRNYNMPHLANLLDDAGMY